MMMNGHGLDISVEAYREAAKELDRVWSRLSRACGLSEGEYWALVMIREGCTTQTEISEQLSMNKQTVHSALKQLIRRGIVRLETQPGNLRVKEIVLTEAGESFTEKYVDTMMDIEERVWNELTKAERREMIRASQKYNRLLKKALEQYFES
ncbi:MarR family winged helix-turn-helix transcriptional regulator [Gehongia tenuis]|uniref:Winged helix-turn-helix transcriptional regulator n=1 Tax=Gehongia tenuis TaxID=2763655 RepID=A0A926D3E3_9FIRM|nr:MarR family transcriptional regulator [Gehongia tenuis]MBC8530622.1 winged helix-turn-helix transcriptional regulator [Gehongia tenuis]